MRKLKLEELGRISVEEFHSAPKCPVTVVLDNVRSMHNVGSVLRSADAFRVERVCMVGITPQPPHREIRKTAIGAEESVNWQHYQKITPLLDELLSLEYQLIAIEQTDNSLILSDVAVNTSQKYALFMGHEVHGVSDIVIERCHHAVEIPQFGTKHSLNVSIAAGISMYHFCLPFMEG